MRSSKSSLLLLFAAIAFCAVQPAQAESEPSPTWKPEDFFEVRGVWGPVFSPDGEWIAFSIEEDFIGPDVSETVGHIWQVRRDGSETFQLTRGEHTSHGALYSPDGRWIAFLSARAGGADELWLIRPDGGEARQLTHLGEDVQEPRWTPDSGAILFLADEPVAPERSRAIQNRDDALVVGSDRRNRHLWRIAADLEKRPAATRITSGDFHIEDYDLSPDGSKVVFARLPSSRGGQWREGDLALVSAQGGEITALVTSPGMDVGGKFSPDGRTVAFVSDRGERSWARDWRICLVPTEGGEVTVLPPSPDRMPGEDLDGGVAGWSYDGSGVYYVELHGTDIQLFFAPVDGRTHVQVSRGPGVKFGFSFSADRRWITFMSQDWERPPEIHLLSAAGGPSTAVTAVNADLPERPLSKSEVIRWRSEDLEIEGILHYPLGYEKGQRYPTLVHLHGGPTWAFLQGFSAGGWDKSQMFTARGYAVLQVNPRGSAGYGKDFRFANLGDWGGGDVRDVLAGVDHLVASGIADPERLGVFGWSYGGFLTGMTIAKSQRFAAAVVGAGPVNPVSFTGTTDITGFIPSFMQSEFWQEPELWVDRSAVFHAASITTPTLILHGENDRRVPLSQGHELNRALERAGVPHEMVIYPRSGHGVGEPKLALDRDHRLLAWFERWLGNDPPAEP